MADVELTGSVTWPDLERVAPGMVARLAPGVFQDVSGLYRHLQSRGSLTLRDAILTLPANAGRSFLGLHKLTLIRSRIFINGSDALVVCNEIRNENSAFVSFPQDADTAAAGPDGPASGERGTDGEDGLDAGTLRMFITDVVSTVGLLRIALTGQHGGLGGSGAPGTKGAKGKRGRGCASGVLNCKTGCGDGGRGRPGQLGGSGGNGGDGGNAGSGEVRLHGNEPTPDRFFSYSGDGGLGGRGGGAAAGGEGGEGGDPGKSGCRFCEGRCHRGPKGLPGGPGTPGEDGRNGSSSFLKSGTFDVAYLKWILETTAARGSEATPPFMEVRTGVSATLRDDTGPL